MIRECLCQKDNRSVPVEKGCLHPLDYCPHRQSCMLHFLEKERVKGAKKAEHPEDIPSSSSSNEDPPYK